MWISFTLLMTVMLAVDLGINRRSHRISNREALTWSCVWVGLALLFNLGIYLLLGRDPALEFLAGYLIEKSLSVDNLFVFVMIFATLGISDRYQSRILKWGIIALVMRAGFIFAGAELLDHFRWLFWVFGILLIATAGKMAFSGEANEVRPETNLAVRLVKRFLPITRRIHGPAFQVGDFYCRWRRLGLGCRHNVNTTLAIVLGSWKAARLPAPPSFNPFDAPFTCDVLITIAGSSALRATENLQTP